MSNPFLTATQFRRGPATAPQTPNGAGFIISAKAVVVGAILATFAALAILLTRVADPQLGKGVGLVGVVILCAAYPSAILWAYLVLFCTLQVMAAEGQLAQGAYIFPGLMLIIILIQSGKFRDLKITRATWAPYLIYLLIVLKGIALPSVLSQSPSADFLPVFVFGLAILLLRTDNDRKLLSQAFVTASVIISLWTVLRFRTGQVHLQVGAENRGTTGQGDQFDPNQLSEYIGFGLMISIAALLELRGTLKKIAYVPLVAHIVIGVWAMALLASRGTGPLSILVATAIMLMVYYRKPLKSLAALVILLGLGWQLAQLPTFALLLVRFGHTNEVATGNGRTVLWLLGLNHVLSADIPVLLFGEGGGASKGLVGTVLHNQFLQVLVEYGTLGVLSLIWLFKSAAKSAFSMNNPTRTADVGVLIYLIIVCLSIVPMSRGWGVWGWLILAMLVPGHSAITNQKPAEAVNA